MKFKAEITDGKTMIETACTVTEMLLTEMLPCITMITHDLYSHLPDGEVKDFFKFAFKKAVNDDVPFIDKKACEKVAEKYAEEIEGLEQEKDKEETTDKKLDEIMKKMRELKGLLDDD